MHFCIRNVDLEKALLISSLFLAQKEPLTSQPPCAPPAPQPHLGAASLRPLLQPLAPAPERLRAVLLAALRQRSGSAPPLLGLRGGLGAGKQPPRFD